MNKVKVKAGDFVVIGLTRKKRRTANPADRNGFKQTDFDQWCRWRFDPFSHLFVAHSKLNRSLLGIGRCWSMLKKVGSMTKIDKWSNRTVDSRRTDKINAMFLGRVEEKKLDIGTAREIADDRRCAKRNPSEETSSIHLDEWTNSRQNNCSNMMNEFELKEKNSNGDETPSSSESDKRWTNKDRLQPISDGSLPSLFLDWQWNWTIDEKCSVSFSAKSSTLAWSARWSRDDVAKVSTWINEDRSSQWLSTGSQWSNTPIDDRSAPVKEKESSQQTWKRWLSDQSIHFSPHPKMQNREKICAETRTKTTDSTGRKRWKGKKRSPFSSINVTKSPSRWIWTIVEKRGTAIQRAKLFNLLSSRKISPLIGDPSDQLFVIVLGVALIGRHSAQQWTQLNEEFRVDRLDSRVKRFSISFIDRRCRGTIER